MKHFMYKLIPPRPAFHLDMNEEEKMIMGSHMQYWADLFSKGKTVVYGPVLDPAGVFGLAVIETETEEEAQKIVTNDPAVSSKLNTYELHPMLTGLVRK